MKLLAKVVNWISAELISKSTSHFLLLLLKNGLSERKKQDLNCLNIKWVVLNNLLNFYAAAGWTVKNQLISEAA